MTILRTVKVVNFVDGEIESEESFEVDVTVEVNTAALSDLDILVAKMGELRSFLADVDVEFALNVNNSTALTAQQQNRLNKALIRQARRDANATIRLFRYVFGQLHPELLDDITDI